MNYGKVHIAIKKFCKCRIYEIIIHLDAKVIITEFLPNNKKATLLKGGRIYLLSTLTIEQKRYYLLHELGHLAIHHYIADRLKNPWLVSMLWVRGWFLRL